MHNRPEPPRSAGPAFRIPKAPRTIEKGVPLKNLLSPEAVACLAHNISLVWPAFAGEDFQSAACAGLEPLGLLDRGQKIGDALRQFLPKNFSAAVDVLLNSLPPPSAAIDDPGLSVFFYLPHVTFVARYGLDPAHNGGRDPFDIAMKAQYELTQRFSAEFSIRPFLIRQQERTLAQLMAWTRAPSPHVRRLCSEGTRPRLPWATRIPAFIKDPSPALPILEALKDDPSLYVRRSVANHLGDIAKDHPDLVFAICARWLQAPTTERNWLIRHALRHPAKKANKTALRLRAAAKA